MGDKNIKRQCVNYEEQTPCKRLNVRDAGLKIINQNSLSMDFDQNTDEKKKEDNDEKIGDLSDVMDTDIVPMYNTTHDSQSIINMTTRKYEMNMEAFKGRMMNEMMALRKQVQDQTLKIDDMRRRLENIGLHIPVEFANKFIYKAMYDYNAAEPDEVTFQEGDFIVDPEPIDEGWMMGTVKSTGLRGMLPSNYVKLYTINCQCGIHVSSGATSC